MRTLVEQYLCKGPRVHYHVALQQHDDGRLEVVHRWANPKGSDEKRLPCPDEARGRAMVQWKLEELRSRGYDKRPDRRAEGTAGTREALAMVAAATVEVPQPVRTETSSAQDTLATLLDRRRREAAWPLD